MVQQPPGGQHVLVPHPASPMPAVSRLVVTVARPSADILQLGWILEADLPQLRLPEPRPPVRADGLWRHTCFEAFLGRASGTDYLEYNFSPSGAWAAYHFAAYREGMAPLMRGAAPVILCNVGARELRLDATVDLGGLGKPAAAGLRLGLTAVVEDKSQVLSYWALNHPAEKPDFHHPDGRMIALE